jgi:hypothetical protein
VLPLVTKRVLDHELVPLRAYCDDVGAMAPSEAWSPWWRRALNFIGFILETPEGVVAIVIVVAVLRAFID